MMIIVSHCSVVRFITVTSIIFCCSIVTTVYALRIQNPIINTRQRQQRRNSLLNKSNNNNHNSNNSNNTDFNGVTGNKASVLLSPLKTFKKSVVSDSLMSERTTTSKNDTDVVLAEDDEYPFDRPAIVKEAIKNKQDIYYFGIGSNMLRTKIENRGINNTKIELKSIEPAYVHSYRLAFNMRGSVPLEPGMGSLEPINNASSKPLLQYEKPECHGALCKVTYDNYEKIMRSEGIYKDNKNPGYEEIVIQCIPYDKSKEPVTAIALRARKHVRLAADPAPSKRYMNILRQGAKELQLNESYQNFLQQHPIQVNKKIIQNIAIYNLICTATLSFKYKIRIISRIQSWFLFKIYIPTNNNNSSSNVLTKLQHAVSQTIMGTMLLPGATFGYIYYHIYLQRIMKQPLSPFLQRFIDNIKSESSNDENSKEIVDQVKTTSSVQKQSS